MQCDRCGKESLAYVMSFFNRDEICMECQSKEQAHPKYAEARRVEAKAVSEGDFNYPGIGRPADL